MAQRIETPFTNEHFAGFVSKMVGQPYWYGTTGNRASESLLKRKKAQYPDHYPESRMERYRKDIKNGAIVCDCIGGAKAYCWTGGGDKLLEALKNPSSAVSSAYGANGCPDKSANGMFSYAKAQKMPYGEMATLPKLPGVALWKSGHIGYTLDGEWAVEWRSFAYGCVKTKISARDWKNWFCLPFLQYGETQSEPEAAFVRSVRIASAGGRVNIRAGNGEGYPVLMKAENGARFEFVAAAENGWNAVRLESCVGWVSATYSGIL